MRDFFRFDPQYHQRVWGGRALEDLLGRALPEGLVGESWEIVDRPEAQSVIRDGKLAGTTLRELLDRDPAGIMGPGWPAGRRFPILVKWLDCRERLSLQVHPPAAVAAALGGEPKTENWFVAASGAGAHLIVGLRRGVTQDQFEQAVASGSVDDRVNRFPVAAGDSILVESGRVHAIDAGSVILEIQQNSDTTFRVFDWGRMGLDGKPRKMHLREALRSIKWDDFEAEPVPAARVSGVIAECAQFRIRRVILGRDEKLSLAPGEQPRIGSVVTGTVRVNGVAVDRGDNLLLPYAGEFEIRAFEPALLLVTENFAGRPLGG